MKEVYKSKVYTERPAYADFDAPEKFQAIQSIIARRLREHPNAICSYSGGADSDIMIDAVERARAVFSLPPIKYVFFNTGLEMKATKDHVKATAEKYGVEIKECCPKVNKEPRKDLPRRGTSYGGTVGRACGEEGWRLRWRKYGIQLRTMKGYMKSAVLGVYGLCQEKSCILLGTQEEPTEGF